MRWNREEYLELMTFGRVERPMFVELFGPLVGLEKEWRQQGASEDELNLTAFDFDYVAHVSCGGHTGPFTSPPVTIEETDEHLVQRDFLGRTIRLCKKTATIPLPETFPVKNMDDWLRIRPLFQFCEDRIDWRQVDLARIAQRRGEMVVASIPGAYAMPRELMGEEELSIAYYEQPDLVHDMLNTFFDTAFRTLEPISRRLVIDQLSIHEDFAGRSGPLAGPKQIREFFRPYYSRIIDLLRDRGTRIFQQDSDGNINAVIDDLLDCGLTSLYPMEPAAGMDIVQLRRKYGQRFATLGGIDKHVLRKDKAAIRAELEYKLQPLMRQGGCVFGLDHRIPNGTPLDNYRYYAATARAMLGLPPLLPGRRGWRRMAF